MLKIWWVWNIEIWSEELVDFNCLLVFPTHFNSNNSVFKLLQILPLFMFTPGLSKAYPFLRVARPRSQVDNFKFLRLIANVSSFDNFLLQL